MRKPIRYRALPPKAAFQVEWKAAFSYGRSFLGPGVGEVSLLLFVRIQGVGGAARRNRLLTLDRRYERIPIVSIEDY